MRRVDSVRRCSRRSVSSASSSSSTSASVIVLSYSETAKAGIRFDDDDDDCCLDAPTALVAVSLAITVDLELAGDSQLAHCKDELAAADDAAQQNLASTSHHLEPPNPLPHAQQPSSRPHWLW